MTEEVLNVAPQGNGLVNQVGVFFVETIIAVVSEIADDEYKGIDSASLLRPSASFVIERHCGRRHSQIIYGISGKSLPLRHQTHFFNAAFKEIDIKSIPECPQQTAPITDLAEADTIIKEMVQEMREHKNDVIVRGRKENI